MTRSIGIRVFKGDDLAGTHVFERDIIKIGRLASAHLRLEDPKVSRIHAVIDIAAGRGEVSIIDMGSAEGTRVNGDKISRIRLKDGDEVGLGDSRLEIVLDDSAVKALAGASGASEAASDGDASDAPAGNGESNGESVFPAAAIAPAMTAGTAPPGAAPPSDTAVAPAPEEPAASSQGPSTAVGEGTEQMPGRGQLSRLPEPGIQDSAVFTDSIPDETFAQLANLEPASSDTGVFDSPSGLDVDVELDAFTGGDPGPAAGPGTPEVPTPADPASAPPPAAQPAMPQPAVIPPPGAQFAPPAEHMETALPPLPEDPITPENRMVEVGVRWGGSVVEVRRLRDKPKLIIGTGKNADLFMPLDDLGVDEFELIHQHPGSPAWVLHYTPQMGGTVTRAGQTVPLMEAGGQPAENGTFVLEITDGMQADISLGYFTLEIRSVARSRLIPLVPLMDMFFINTALVSIFSFASLVSVLLLLPTGLDDDLDDLTDNMSQFQTVILKPPPKNNEFLERLKEKQQNAAAQKDRGKSGSKKSKNKSKQTRSAVKSEKKEKPSDAEIVAQKLKELLGDEASGGFAQLFNNEAGGGALQAALGGISGAQVADAYGSGGLSVRGSAPGGGGVAVGTLGMGRVGTMGRGTGNAAYGSSAGGLGAKKDRSVKISQGKPIILGSLDKEIIRRVVREHMNQIRYCYERELTRTPGLYGKVQMKWIINGQGRVQSAKVDQTTMKNKTVETCMGRKIRTWKFPKPKGGGIVIVNYPFVFKQSN